LASAEPFVQIRSRQSLLLREQRMPREFLRRIERVPLPIEVRTPQDIRNAAVLRAAGMLEAIVPREPLDDGSSGTILKITPLGRAELKRDASD
jgi:hypothetical protein